MESSKIRSLTQTLLHKYQYVLIVAIVGVLLLTWPRHTAQEAASADTTAAFTTDTTSMEQRMAHILEKIDGVGETEVLLTLSGSSRRRLAEDETSNEARSYGDSGMVLEDRSDMSRKVVLVSGSGGSQTPYVLEELAPDYQGALIVCEGADAPSVRLAVTEAVSRLTGLPSSRISVVKMQ